MIKMPQMLNYCDGILFSGGEDVHPALYGKPEFVQEYGLKEIIPARDQFEYEVIEKALESKKPVLGICRGLATHQCLPGWNAVTRYTHVIRINRTWENFRTGSDP